VASEYLTKGAPILIEGRLKLDTWETSDGQKRSKLKVVCDRMQMLGSRGAGASGGGGGGGGSGASGGRPAPPPSTPAAQAPPQDFEYDPAPPEPSGGDDIPF
jgi:single-strand DNA-binding protein